MGISLADAGISVKLIDRHPIPVAGASRWNEGKIHVLGVQPKALSHGSNLQYGPGRDVIWLGLPDDLDPYIQLNARIYRQGVTSMVRIHRILIRDSVDVASLDRIDRKDSNQQAVLNALRRYRKTKIAA